MNEQSAQTEQIIKNKLALGAAERKSYSQPKLRRMGALAELTAGNSLGNTDPFGAGAGSATP